MASYVDLRKSADPAKQASRRPHMVRFRDHAGRQRSEQFSRKPDAIARLREVETAEQTGRLDALDDGKQTLAELGAQFVSLEKSGWSAQTLDENRAIWNAVVLGRGAARYPRAALADMPARSIRKSHVTQFREDALTAGVPPSSVGRALSLVKRTLDMAEDDGLIAANPAARVKSPRKPPRPPVNVVTPDEVERIRAKLKPRDAAIVSILAYAGLRPAELRALTPGHLGKPYLHLTAQAGHDGVLKAMKSKNSRRSVPVCAALAADVAAVDWGTEFLLESVNGGAWTQSDWANWRNRRFAPAVEAAGVPLKDPYKLRHSIASLWFREGTDRATIASWLGHSITELQETYAQAFKSLDPSDRRSVDEMIAAARSGR